MAYVVLGGEKQSHRLFKKWDRSWTNRRGNKIGAYEFPRKPLILLGAEGQNRTADTGIFSPLLYRLSYLGEPALKAIK